MNTYFSRHWPNIGVTVLIPHTFLQYRGCTDPGCTAPGYWLYSSWLLSCSIGGTTFGYTCISCVNILIALSVFSWTSSNASRCFIPHQSHCVQSNMTCDFLRHQWCLLPELLTYFVRQRVRRLEHHHLLASKNYNDIITMIFKHR